MSEIAVDTAAIASLDKRLALVEQGADLRSKAADAQSVALQKSVDALAAEIHGALVSFNNAIADPAASPMGRQLIAADGLLRNDVTDQADIIAAHDRFIAEARGALRLAKFALGTSFASSLGTLLLGLVYWAHHP